MTNETTKPKPEQKTIDPVTPDAQTQDDRYSTPSNPGQMGKFGERKRDGARLANNVEKNPSAAPRSDTAQRDSDVNSFDAARGAGGSIKNDVV